MNMSILGKERAKGYSEGWSQASMVRHDDAHERGWAQGWHEGCRAGRWWWLAGALIGFVVGWLA